MNILISTDSFPPQIIGSSYAYYNLALGLAKRAIRYLLFAHQINIIHTIIK
jgi:hypothetical protein